MQRGRAGFSTIELLIVLIVFGVLTAIVVPGVAQQHSSRQALNARDSLIWMSARARSLAQERGTMARLRVEPGAGRSQILLDLPGGSQQVVEELNYDLEFAATMTAAMDPVVVCYSPRGFAAPGCGSFADSGVSEIQITFTRGGSQAGARIRPLGQVERN